MAVLNNFYFPVLYIVLKSKLHEQKKHRPLPLNLKAEAAKANPERLKLPARALGHPTLHYLA